MTDHPLTEDRAVEMWDASPCSEGYEFRGMLTVEQDATVYAMRAAFDAGREHERTNPDVDARPWEPLNGRTPRVGDELRVELNGITRSGVVGRVNEYGDPWTNEGALIGRARVGTWYVRRAATPPAVGVELPGEPCVLTDVQLREVLAAGVALWTGLEAVTTGFNGRAVAHSASDLTAFTLPDGTRARRDGNHADGTPRFVKAGGGDQ